jgi:hypothetical protein
VTEVIRRTFIHVREKFSSAWAVETVTILCGRCVRAAITKPGTGFAGMVGAIRKEEQAGLFNGAHADKHWNRTRTGEGGGTMPDLQISIRVHGMMRDENHCSGKTPNHSRVCSSVVSSQ